MKQPIILYEHDKLIINQNDNGFTKTHWDALVKLNVLHENKYFDILHNGIRFKQFVGVLQVDNLLIEINPKADKDHSNDAWKTVLLGMLKACGRIKAQTVGNANLKKQHLNLLEVYFEYFLRELEFLIHSGLVKKYRKETGNVKALKGKLDFAGSIRHNLVHKERFYTVHQVYDTNHKLHQVLSHALNIVSHFTKGTRLGDFSKRTQLDFPEVATIKPTAQLLNSIEIDRKTAPYERALELAKLIILNYSPDITGGQNKMIALLFDMNQLWEEYVYVKLKKHIILNNLNWSITPQDSNGFWGYNTLKPDIVLREKTTKKTIIIDTKWKRPGDSASVEDLRQMYAYARFWKAEKVMLLYPGTNRNTEFRTFLTDDYWNHDSEVKGIKHDCKMGFVSVLEGDKLDDNIGGKIFNILFHK